MSGRNLAVLCGGSLAFVAASMSALPFGPRIVFKAEDGAGSGGKSASELAAEFKREFETKHDKVKEIAEKALNEAEKGATLSSTTKELADQAITGMNEAKARLDDLEQKLARRGGGDGDEGRTAGQRFVEDEGFKSFAGQTRPRGRHIVEVKDISSLTTDAAGSVGTMVQPQRVQGTELPRRRMTIRALLAQGNTNSNSIEYDKEKLFTNNAAPVAEGALKPQSELQYEEATAPGLRRLADDPPPRGQCHALGMVARASDRSRPGHRQLRRRLHDLYRPLHGWAYRDADRRKGEERMTGAQGYQGPGVWIRIQHRFGPRMMEWFMAFHMMLFGAVLLMPAVTFNQPAWRTFREIGLGGSGASLE